jgi:hypothetical protein
VTRESIPKKLRDTLLDEYDHRCAVCGGDRPHVHHIDEDATHNELSNLLPLCPNCHLRDQHNPTRKIDIPKLQIFRKFKDPAVLKPQFHPIYLRQTFLDTIVPGDSSVGEIELLAKELIEFIQALEMGEFYGKRLKELVGPLQGVFIISLNAGPDPHYEKQRRHANQNYREKLISNREPTKALLVELLRYQSWANA